jgi:hypothetical protein
VIYGSPFLSVSAASIYFGRRAYSMADASAIAHVRTRKPEAKEGVQGKNAARYEEAEFKLILVVKTSRYVYEITCHYWESFLHSIARFVSRELIVRLKQDDGSSDLAPCVKRKLNKRLGMTTQVLHWY